MESKEKIKHLKWNEVKKELKNSVIWPEGKELDHLQYRFKNLKKKFKHLEKSEISDQISQFNSQFKSKQKQAEEIYN